MRTKNLIFAVAMIAMLFTSCETLSNLFGGNFFNSNSESGSGEQKVTPISKSEITRKYLKQKFFA